MRPNFVIKQMKQQASESALFGVHQADRKPVLHETDEVDEPKAPGADNC